MYYGVCFDDKHSYRDYGMFLSQEPDIGSPEPKVEVVEIPGADGTLDFTEAITGDVKYSNRPLNFLFSAMVDRDKQADFKSALMDDLHGKIKDIVLDSDPDWIYRGRCSVSFENVEVWRLQILVSVDAAPYKTAMRETSITIKTSDLNYTEFSLANNTSSSKYNSDFRIGTKTEPEGDWDAFGSVRVRWTSQSKHRDPQTTSLYVRFYDSYGNTYQSTLNFSDLLKGVTLATLRANNIDTTKIYRVYVYGIGGCTLFGIGRAAKKVLINNDRMLVVPNFKVTTQNEIPVLVNGRTNRLHSGDYQDPDISLKSGTNELVFFGNQNDTTQTVEMSFTRGRL